VRFGSDGRRALADLMAIVGVCGSRWGSGKRLLCPKVWLIGFDWVALTMRFADACGAECNTGQLLGRAAAYLVNDQRGRPLAVGVRNVAVSLVSSILIAGTNRIAPFTHVGLGDFDAVFALNVKASYFVAQSVARRLMAAGRTGSIIQISSQLGHVVPPNVRSM